MGVWPARAPTRRALVQREAPVRVSAISKTQRSLLREVVVLFTLRGFAPLQPRPPNSFRHHFLFDRARDSTASYFFVSAGLFRAQPVNSASTVTVSPSRKT